MTDKEILQKAIEKAERNGFDVFHWYVYKNDGPVAMPSKEMILSRIHRNKYYYLLIFNHDFAKAFWKNYEITETDFKNIPNLIRAWQFHLKQMVIEHEPLKYLEKFL